MDKVTIFIDDNAGAVEMIYELNWEDDDNADEIPLHEIPDSREFLSQERLHHRILFTAKSCLKWAWRPLERTILATPDGKPKKIINKWPSKWSEGA